MVLAMILGGLALYAGQARRDQILVERAHQKAAQKSKQSKPLPSPSPGAERPPQEAEESELEPLSFVNRRYQVCRHNNLDYQPREYAKLRKGSSEQLLLRGVAYQSRQQYERALGDFQAALDRNSRDPRLYGHVAELYESMEDYEKALAFIEVALELDPDFYMFYGNRSWYHIKLGNQKQAEADWATFLSVSPKKRHEVAALAAQYRRRGMLDQALPLAERTIAMDRAYGSYWTLGKTLRELGRGEEALAAYLEGLEQTPWSAGLHEEAAELYEEMGHPGKARAHREELARLKAEVLK